MIPDHRPVLERALDIPACFDPINRIEGAVSTFTHADWQGAYRRHGVAGLVLEFCACVFSTNAPTIRVYRFGGWSGVQIERLLKSRGVPLWDRGIMGTDYSFSVPRRQVRWAEYVLAKSGVPVTSDPH